MDEEIIALVQKSEEPQQKALLLVLLKISNALTENTDLTKNVAEQFEKHRSQFERGQEDFRSHVIQEQKLYSKGVGAWKTIGVGSLLVFAMAGYILRTSVSQLDKSTGKNETQDLAIATLIESNRLQDITIGRTADRVEQHEVAIKTLDVRTGVIERELSRSGVVRPDANPRASPSGR